MFAITSSDLLRTRWPFSVRCIRCSAKGTVSSAARMTLWKMFVLRRAVFERSGRVRSKRTVASSPSMRSTSCSRDRVSAV